MRYIVGIDLGTTGCKAILFDMNGVSYAYSYHEYPLSMPAPGHNEQSTEKWWKALCACTKDIINQSKITARDVVAVGLTTQADGLVCLDKVDNVLRPAIICSDQRAGPQARQIKNQLGSEIENVLGVPMLTPMSACARILWLREHEPELEKSTRRFLDTKGYLAYRLTGEGTLDLYTAWIFGIANVLQKRETKEVLEIINVPREKFGRVCMPSDVIGYITRVASKETGLREGTPVTIGAWDGLVNIVGSGLTEHGMTMDVTGTTEIVSTLVRPMKEAFGFPYVIEGKNFLYASIGATGACLAWFKDQFFRLEADEAEELGKNPYEILDLEAEAAEPGSKNLIYLPFLEGFQSPTLSDLNAKGVFLGVTLNHRRKHFVRSIMESVAYYVRLVLESWEERGVTISEPIRVSGGGAKSRLWNQIKADVTGKSVAALKTFETGCLGAALLASVGVGIHRDVEEAARSMVSIAERFEPKKGMREKYARLFEIYKDAYDRLRPVFPKLART